MSSTSRRLPRGSLLVAAAVLLMAFGYSPTTKQAEPTTPVGRAVSASTHSSQPSSRPTSRAAPTSSATAIAAVCVR